MLTALKGWMSKTPLEPPNMRPNDWSRVRAISACRVPESYDRREDPNAPFRHWRITIYADVPERPRLFWVSMQEETRTIQFGAVHRGGL
jgi:hypothetical protein